MEKDKVKYPITIEGVFIAETAEAWHLDCEGDKEWFPKSQCHFDSENNEVTAPKWMLKQKFPDYQF